MSWMVSSPLVREYKRFKFPGFVGEGTCFLRVSVTSEGMVVLCAQLLDYQGTSVTNVVEDIAIRVINQLDKDIGLFDFVMSGLPFFRSRDKSLRAVKERMTWIEHYPAGAAVADDETFAIVNFGDRFEPVWSYVSKERAAAAAGVDLEFLSIDPMELRYGQ